MTCYCYMLLCADDTFYTGWTTDPQRRLKQHNTGRGARYTRTRCPVKLVYLESQPNRSAAMRREIQLKRLPREKKQRLAALSFPSPFFDEVTYDPNFIPSSSRTGVD